MIEIKLDTYSDFKNNVETRRLKHYSYEKQNRLFLVAVDGPIYYTHTLSNTDRDDYDNNLSAASNIRFGDEVVMSPFAYKGTYHFKGTGVEKLIPANSTDSINLTVGSGIYKYNGIEILNGDYGDEVQLKILDTPTGTYSGYPDFVLDQFGINWKMRKELIKTLPYDATLYPSMVISVIYTNNQNTDKTIYVNHELHLEL